MKLDFDDIKEIAGYMELAKQLAPLADDVVETLFTYGPAIKKLFGAWADFNRATNKAAFDFYIGQDFTREEALLLVVNTNHSLRQLMQNIGKTKNQE